MEVKAAICQRPPVLLDKKASMAAAVAMVAEAAGQGAKLMTFPEAFLPGYPTWVWRCAPAPTWRWEMKFIASCNSTQSI